VTLHSSRIDEMLRSSNDGRWGYLLKEVGGSYRFRVSTEELFEPASTVKIAYLLHALRQLDAGEVALDAPIPWYQASTAVDDPSTPQEDEREYGCPVDRDPAVGRLETGLRLMMERSDNRWTQAIRRYFGEEAILRTARDAGMVRTRVEHRIGCASDTGTDPGQISAPNASTLSELCGTVERIAAGELLSPEGKALSFDLMANDPLFRLSTIFGEESAAVGLPKELAAAVERRQELAWKSGKYNIGDYKCQSVVALARLYSYAEGAIGVREYVLGVFVDDAHSFPEQGTRATLYSLAVASEMLRDEVRAVLVSFRRAMDEIGGAKG
jgi:hypothetical protein